MSAFTTPSRGSAAAQRGGGSSNRRVVRSALELLMDSATPELPGRTAHTDKSTHSSSSSRNHDSAVLKEESTKTGRQTPASDTVKASSSTTATAAAPSSSFSVSYAAAPAVHHVPPSEKQLRSKSAAAPSASPPSASSSTRARSEGATSGSSGGSHTAPGPLKAHPLVEEPSALAFLSPQGKSSRPLSSSSFAAADAQPAVPRERSSRPQRRGASSEAATSTAHRHRTAHIDNDDDYGDVEDNDGDVWHRETRREAAERRHISHRNSTAAADASFAPAPASPSRSLYPDVVAAQQTQHSTNSNIAAPSSRAASFASAATSQRDAETSFVTDDEDGEDGDGVAMHATASGHRRSDYPVRDVRRKGHDDGDVSMGDGDAAHGAFVPAAEVQALISAALRRYEKERDAEEEAVLEQVSAEVAEQAHRYATLADAYDTVCAEAAALQARVAQSQQTCQETEAALLKARQTQEAQRASMQRLEVELYHARDAQSRQQQQHEDAEAAEWAAVRRRYEKRQTTLEAQLAQLREEVQEKDAQIADVTGQLARKAAEVDALRQRTTQREADVEGDYAELHERMRRLAQNMSTMESTLQARDGVIAELQEQLAAAMSAADQRTDADAAERERTSEALAATQEALQRHVDEARKRMHRLTLVEQQKDTLRAAVREASQALAKSAEEQAGVAQALAELMREVTRLTASPSRRGKVNTTSRAASTAAAVGTASRHARPLRRSVQREEEEESERGGSDDGRSDRGVRGSSSESYRARRAARPDDTLVYEDGEGDESETGTADRALSSDSAFSDGDEDALESSTVAVSEAEHGDAREEEEEEGVGYRPHAHLSSKSPKLAAQRTRSSAGETMRGVARRDLHTPTRQPFSAPATSALTHSTATTTTTTTTAAETSTTASAAWEKDQRTVRRTAQTLHHHVARAQTLLRELRRRVVSLTKRRVPSPAQQARDGDSNGAPRLRSASPSHNNSSTITTTTNAATAARPADLVHKLEQACRYLKSELAASTAQLHEAQAECQWRTLSMKKFEDDLQAARRDIFRLEKAQLTHTTEREGWDIARQELEEQLAEAQQHRTALEAELTSVKALHVEAQQQLQGVTAARTTAEAALEKEVSKSSRLAEKLTELTAAHATLLDELSVAQDKYKTALTNLQTLRAQEATQQQRDQQERKTHTTELAELRSAVAQLRLAEGGWEAERARLQRSVEQARSAHDAAERQRSAVVAEAALRADVEQTTLLTIADVVGAPVLQSGRVGSGDSEGGTSPTEKKLFDAEEPSVEAVTVMEENSARKRAAFTAVVHASMQQQQQQAGKRQKAALPGASPQAARTPSQRRTGTTIISSNNGSPVARSASSSTVNLAQLRHDVVAAVQRAALELTKLRAAQTAQRSPPYVDAAGVSPPVVMPVRHRPASRSNEEGSFGGGDQWFGGAAAGTSSSPTQARRTTVPLLEEDGSGSGGGGYAQGSSIARTPHLQRPATAGAHTSHPPAGAASALRRTSSRPVPQRFSAPLPLNAQPYSSTAPLSVAAVTATPQRLQTAVAAASPAPSAAAEHVYNISPWMPSRQPQWSPSASPPMALAKAWGEVRRSSSMEGGLSGDSHSTERGDVDGSGSPARPPSLRAASLTH